MADPYSQQQTKQPQQQRPNEEDSEPRTFEEKIARLKSLGFEDADAVKALTKSKFDLNEAAGLLVSGAIGTSSGVVGTPSAKASVSTVASSDSAVTAYPTHGTTSDRAAREAKRRAEEKESEEVARRLQEQFDTEVKEDREAGVESTDTGLKGMLWKMSKFRKAWRKRFIWMDGTTLRTYTEDNAGSAKEDNARDTFELTEDSKVEDLKSGDKAKQEHGWTVTNVMDKGTKSSLVLAATDSAGAARWRAAIRDAFREKKKRDRTAMLSANREKCGQLQAMGYGKNECMNALEQAEGDLDAAVELLLSGAVSSSAPSSSSFSPTSSSPSSSSSSSSTAAREEADLAAAIAASLADSGATPSVAATSVGRTLKVTLPADAVPGQELTVSAPDGQNYRIRVPATIPASRQITMAY
jgi:Holliday junction resolvasome RuvABC DNA-binding subunit